MRRLSVFVPVLAIAALVCPDCHAAAVPPEGAIWLVETIREPHAPDGFLAALGWLQACTAAKDQPAERTARVSIDWIAFKAKDGQTGEERLLVREDYAGQEGGPLPEGSGGLYVRSPSWFLTDDHAPVWNSEVAGGVLAIDAALTPDNIIHFWTERADLSGLPDLDRQVFFLEVRVKVEGDCALQLGCDFWRSVTAPWVEDPPNNCESWISDWICDTGGAWRTVRAPLALAGRLPAVLAPCLLPLF